MRSQIEMRPFTEADIPFGMKLKDIAGWNQIEDDWRRFLALGPNGCFVAILDGERVGTVTTTAYGKRFGWVGMVLVPPDKRRRGIGTALLHHGIKYLEGIGVAAVRLDATPLGKKLYDTIGFKDEYHLERKQGKGRRLTVSDTRVGVMKREDLPEVVSFDEPYFGANRRSMISLLLNQRPDLCFIHKDDEGEITGYLMARPGKNAFQIGPWTAKQPEIAERLFVAGLSALVGEPIFLDAPLVRDHPLEIVTKFGFETQRPFIRMYRGENKYPGDVSGVYSICGVETG